MPVGPQTVAVVGLGRDCGLLSHLWGPCEGGRNLKHPERCVVCVAFLITFLVWSSLSLLCSRHASCLSSIISDRPCALCVLVEPWKGGCCFNGLAKPLSPSLMSSLETSVFCFVSRKAVYCSLSTVSLLLGSQFLSRPPLGSSPPSSLQLRLRSKLVKALLVGRKLGCLFTV